MASNKKCPKKRQTVRNDKKEKGARLGRNEGYGR